MGPSYNRGDVLMYFGIRDIGVMGRVDNPAAYENPYGGDNGLPAFGTDAPVILR